MATGEVNCPDASARADVKNVRNVRSDGCDLKSFVMESFKPDVVLCIWNLDEYSLW